MYSEPTWRYQQVFRGEPRKTVEMFASSSLPHRESSVLPLRVDVPRNFRIGRYGGQSKGPLTPDGQSCRLFLVAPRP